jgi:hypothetical protein
MTLSPEDNLVYLSAHGCKHRWSRLIWVCDIAALVDGTVSLNWSVVFKRAQELDASRMVRLAVYLAMTLLGCSLREDIRATVLADTVARRLGDEIAAGYRRGTNSRPSRLHAKDTSRYYLAIRERTRSRLFYCIYLLQYRWQPTGKDVSIVRLPRAFYAVYYLLRPFRLVREYGWKPVKSYAGQFIRILVATGDSRS